MFKPKKKISIESKREREKLIVEKMIKIYCKYHHRTKEKLCPECQKLADYARVRTDKCPFMENKTFCSNCKEHCYSPAMRERIREVMKFSGPVMLFHNPILATNHVIQSIKEKKKIKKENK